MMVTGCRDHSGASASFAGIAIAWELLLLEGTAWAALFRFVDIS